jgi:hypothetical protein
MSRIQDAILPKRRWWPDRLLDHAPDRPITQVLPYDLATLQDRPEELPSLEAGGRGPGVDRLMTKWVVAFDSRSPVSRFKRITGWKVAALRSTGPNSGREGPCPWKELGYFLFVRTTDIAATHEANLLSAYLPYGWA